MKSLAYQVITDRIISLLESGVVAWQKPWHVGEMQPRNLGTGREYRGINVFLLNAMSFESPYFLTYKQAKDLGGFVRQGEKAAPVVFWKWLQIPDPNAAEKSAKIPLLRYYNVFNLAQCDGIPQSKIPLLVLQSRQHDPIEAAEKIVAAMPTRPEITTGGNRACYSPSLDRVTMPKPESFRSSQDYYSVLFHELTHATGHSSRLGRKGITGPEGEWSSFGSAPYAREELVAEMGSAFLCAQAGIEERTIENSSAYIQAWLERLRQDNRLVIHAASQAQKAAEFILAKECREKVEEGVLKSAA